MLYQLRVKTDGAKGKRGCHLFHFWGHFELSTLISWRTPLNTWNLRCFLHFVPVGNCCQINRFCSIRLVGRVCFNGAYWRCIFHTEKLQGDLDGQCSFPLRYLSSSVSTSPQWLLFKLSWYTVLVCQSIGILPEEPEEFDVRSLCLFSARVYSLTHKSWKECNSASFHPIIFLCSLPVSYLFSPSYPSIHVHRNIAPFPMTNSVGIFTIAKSQNISFQSIFLYASWNDHSQAQASFYIHIWEWILSLYIVIVIFFVVAL